MTFSVILLLLISTFMTSADQLFDELLFSFMKDHWHFLRPSERHLRRGSQNVETIAGQPFWLTFYYIFVSFDVFIRNPVVLCAYFSWHKSKRKKSWVGIEITIIFVQSLIFCNMFLNLKSFLKLFDWYALRWWHWI
jgi:hypothetical protein